MASRNMPRSQGMRIAAYYLARHTTSGNPPEVLGVTSWRAAYELFYPFVGDGRTFETFYRSINAARHALNAHFDNGGAIWRDANGIMPGVRGDYLKLVEEWDGRSDDELDAYMAATFPSMRLIPRRPFAVDPETAKSELASLPPSAEERRWAEGDIRIVAHMKLERVRNHEAVEAKREAVRDANGGQLSCEHCDTDWYVLYGAEVAEGIFDIHHTVPLSQMDEGHQTTIKDLLCLCANCHRAEHRRMALGQR